MIKTHAEYLEVWHQDENLANMAEVASRVAELRPAWKTYMWHSGGGIYLMGFEMADTDIWAFGSGDSKAEGNTVDWIIEYSDEEATFMSNKLGNDWCKDGMDYEIEVTDESDLQKVAEAYVAKIEADLPTLIASERVYY